MQWRDDVESEATGNIFIEIRLVGADSFPARFVNSVLDDISQAIEQAEYLELRAIASEFPELRLSVPVSVAVGIESVHGFGLNIKAASDGSLILAGMAAGLSIWLLDKTLGETLTSAWRDSAMHDRLKSFLSRRFDPKVQSIVDSLSFTKNSSDGDDFSITRLPAKEGALLVIVVKVPSHMQPKPSARDFF